MDFAKVVVMHNYPFNMAEHEYFVIFCNGLQPMFKLVSRNTVRSNNAKFPTLGKIARDILAIPATNVASKTEFSVGGRVIDDFRASLLPKTVEVLVTTQDWLPSLKKKKLDINVTSKALQN